MGINQHTLKNMIDQLREFDESINAQTQYDLLVFVLRFHLLAENMLQRIIINLINKSRLSFAQQLAVVDALGIIDENVVISLDRLNTLRNKCVHKRKMKVTLKEIDSISEPFGEKLSMVKPDPDQEPTQTELNAAVLTTAYFHAIYDKLVQTLAPLEHRGPEMDSENIHKVPE
jgi:uncharacterized protein YutE (UPF0331/DUF86 family)